MTIGDWENFDGLDEFIFLLRYSDNKIRNGCKQSESIDTFCFVSMVHVAGHGGAMVRGEYFHGIHMTHDTWYK